MRLIDADALIAEYDRVHIGEPGKARKLIEDAPTIEPERTGKWIIVDTISSQSSDICACDQCGKTIWRYKDRTQDWNFCPNCGARMES